MKKGKSFKRKKKCLLKSQKWDGEKEMEEMEEVEANNFIF